jgi:ribosomal protein S18 acetylase RimI-like enzyme
MSNIEIVRVNKKNYASFLEMIHFRITGKSYKEKSDRDIVSENIDFSYILENESFYVYSAIVDNKMAGYLSAGVIPKADKRVGTMFIDEVWTHPNFRGRGVAKALVNKIMTISEKLDLWEARLTVDIDNDAARHIYRNAGFVEKECIFGRAKLNEPKFKK